MFNERYKKNCRLPERSIKRSVPTDERTRREENEPEDGQAEVHPAHRVHAEPGQAAHHVGEQRPRVNCSMSRTGSGSGTRGQ